MHSFDNYIKKLMATCPELAELPEVVDLMRSSYMTGFVDSLDLVTNEGPAQAAAAIAAEIVQFSDRIVEKRRIAAVVKAGLESGKGTS